MVPLAGVEPARPEGQQILNLSRLPVPPQRPKINNLELLKSKELKRYAASIEAVSNISSIFVRASSRDSDFASENSAKNLSNAKS